jgi:transcription elongation factor Elf1
MLRRFDCPDCGKFLGRSDGSQLETNCVRCHRVVMATPLELQLTLECERCGRRHYYETPDQRPTYCVVCGLDSLSPVPTLQRPIEVLTDSARGSARSRHRQFQD